MAKVILLTGATGFVGRQVLRALAAKGARVRVVVRKGRERDVEKNPALEKVVSSSDIFSQSAAWWTENCQNVDAIAHVAWYAEPGKYLTSPRNLDCLAGTLAMAQGALGAGVKRFIGIGTCAEYNLSGIGDLSVDTPLAPLTPYGGAKAGAFLALSQILPPQGMEVVWCRLFYLYGEGEDSRRLVPYLRTQLEKGEPALLTGGTQVRDFLDVAEAGRQIARAVLGDVTGGVNICSGEGIAIRQLAERIADEYGRRDLLHFGAHADNRLDQPRIVGVPTFAREIYGEALDPAR